jgi:hypothetical protein
MALFSTLIATLMLIVALICFQHPFSAWSSLEPKAKLFISSISLYLTILTVSGWLYVSQRKRAFGIIHGLLMLSLAAISFYIGFPPLSKSSSYHGEWLTGFLSMALVVIGAVALQCSIGMVCHTFTPSIKKWDQDKEARSMLLMGLGALILVVVIIRIIIWCSPHAPKGVPVYQGP